MNNTVPEKRMDKTGKMVTRHVKPQQPKLPAGTIPAPIVEMQPAEKIILPGDEPISMTKNDLGLIADVLDMCGGIDNEYSHVDPYIRAGDLETLRIFRAHGRSEGFSAIVDVLEATHDLYQDRPGDYVESVGKHIEVAACGYYNYADISGYPPYEAVLQVVHRNLDKVDAIISFMKERGIDAEGLNEYLGNNSPVREGTL